MDIADIAVEQADRDAFITRLTQLIGQRLNFSAIKRSQNIAPCVDAFVDDIAAIARQKGFWKGQV